MPGKLFVPYYRGMETIDIKGNGKSDLELITILDKTVADIIWKNVIAAKRCRQIRFDLLISSNMSCKQVSAWHNIQYQPSHLSDGDDNATVNGISYWHLTLFKGRS